jgi:LysM repeat protein
VRKSKQIFTQHTNPEASFGQFFMCRNVLLVVVITLALVIGSSARAEVKIPSGTIDIDETQFGFIIGGDIGRGTLHYKGVDYYFKTGGIKVGGIGISKIAAAGEVYDLFDISQFPGTYVSGDYGVSLGGGVGGMVLKNQNGVYLRLHSTMEGVALSVGVEGLNIQLEGATGQAQPPQPVQMQQQAAQTYTVQSGDTLYEIANKFGTTVSAVKSANNLTSDMIRVGQVLNIP